MPDLPRPRDREDSWAALAGDALATLDMVARGLRANNRDDLERRRDALLRSPAVPPVSEASPDGMPELADALDKARLDWLQSKVDGCDGIGDVVLAGGGRPRVSLVVGNGKAVGLPEVGGGSVRDAIDAAIALEPEPETAPSGWRYRVIGGAIERENLGKWHHVAAQHLDWKLNVPPIDREYVARLLGGNDGN